MSSKLKIWFYQQLADALIKKLERTEDEKKWNRLYNVAWDFNKYCVSYDIYLN